MKLTNSTTIQIQGDMATLAYFNPENGLALSAEFGVPDSGFGSFRFLDDNNGFFTQSAGIIRFITKLVKANKADDTAKILYHCQDEGSDEPIVHVHVQGIYNAWYVDIVTRIETYYRDDLIEEFHNHFVEMIYSNKGWFDRKAKKSVIESDFLEEDFYYRLEIGGQSKTAKAEIANYLANSKVFYELVARSISI